MIVIGLTIFLVENRSKLEARLAGRLVDMKAREKPNCYSRRIQSARRCNRVQETLLRTKVETIEVQRQHSLKSYNSHILDLRSSGLEKRPKTAPISSRVKILTEEREAEKRKVISIGYRPTGPKVYSSACVNSWTDGRSPSCQTCQVKFENYRPTTIRKRSQNMLDGDLEEDREFFSLMNISDTSNCSGSTYEQSNSLKSPHHILTSLSSDICSHQQPFALPKLPYYNNPGFSLYCSETFSESASEKSTSECLALQTYFEKPFQRDCCKYRHLLQQFQQPILHGQLHRRHDKMKYVKRQRQLNNLKVRNETFNKAKNKQKQETEQSKTVNKQK